jgi:hypothetical protein
MTAYKLISAAAQNGIILSICDDDLRVSFRGMPPTCLLDLIAQHKQEIIAILRARKATAKLYKSDTMVPVLEKV